MQMRIFDRLVSPNKLALIFVFVILVLLQSTATLVA
jgi:hypothetical protein